MHDSARLLLFFARFFKDEKLDLPGVLVVFVFLGCFMSIKNPELAGV